MMPTNFARAAVIAGGLLLAGAATAQQPPQSYFSFLGSFVDPDSNRLTNEEGAAFDLLYGRERSSLASSRTTPQFVAQHSAKPTKSTTCLLYTSPSPRDQRGSRMPSSA